MFLRSRKYIPLFLVLAISLFLPLASGCDEKPPTGASVNASSSTSMQPNTKNEGNDRAQKATTSTSNKMAATTTTSVTLQVQTKPRGKNDKVLLFDTAHAEIFNLNDQKQMGCTEMRDVFTDQGYVIETNPKLFSDSVLDGTKAVVVAGPMSQFNLQEAESLMRYLEKGGNLLMTVHVSYFISNITNALGLQLSKGVLGQRNESFEGASKNFIARGVTGHPTMNGVKGVAVRATWALQPMLGNPYDAKTIVSTSPDSWVDVTPNDMYDLGEPRGSYGIIGVSKVGKGKVIVIGDDAVFTNFTIDMANNRTLCENIAKWFYE